MNQNDKTSGRNGTDASGESGGSELDRARRFAFAMRALSRTPVSIFYQSTSLVYHWAENLPKGMGPDIVGRTDSDLLPRLAADRLIAVKRSVLESGEPRRFELPVNLRGEVRWFDVWIDPDHSEDGQRIGVFSTLIEMTDQKRREVQLRSLLREVSHRSKNLLAIILSLASQTARSATGLQSFVSAFSGRLQAIARAQDLVTDRDWHGALLSDLVTRQVALFRSERPLPVKVVGDDLVISPNAALYVGLAIHELAAAMVRQGRPGSADDRVLVTMRLENGADGSRSLVLEWDERASGDIEEFEPLTLAFLENVVPLAVEGTGELTHRQNGLTYRLRIAAGHIA